MFLFCFVCCYLRAPWRRSSQATLCLKFSKYWSIYYMLSIQLWKAFRLIWCEDIQKDELSILQFSVTYSQKWALDRAVFNLHIFINTSLKPSRLLLAWLLNSFVPIPIIQFQRELHLLRCLFQEHDIPWAWRLEISPIGSEPKFQLCLHLHRDFRGKHFFIPDRFSGY